MYVCVLSDDMSLFLATDEEVSPGSFNPMLTVRRHYRAADEKSDNVKQMRKVGMTLFVKVHYCCLIHVRGFSMNTVVAFSAHELCRYFLLECIRNQHS